MANGGMKGTKTDMSGVKEGSTKPYKLACEYVKQPGNAYGKGPSGMQPSKARTHSYNPAGSKDVAK